LALLHEWGGASFIQEQTNKEQVMTIKLKGETATIVFHSTKVGTIKTEVCSFRVSGPGPFDPTSIAVTYMEPCRRKGGSYILALGDPHYLTIEHNDQVIYDSRTDVPIETARQRSTA
jgi:hypothetical protein